jgi:hypothetical protein
MKQLIVGFVRDERGTVIVETVIVAPLLFWTVIALFSYWDVYRSVNVIQKAAYTVSDIISRRNEVEPLKGADFIGYKKLMNYLIDQDQDAFVRVTSLTWDAEDAQYEVLWSCSPNMELPAVTDAELNSPAYTDRIPVMPDNDTVVLVEAGVEYVPVFDVGVPYYGTAIEEGLESMIIEQFVITKPRLAPQIYMDSCV